MTYAAQETSPGVSYLLLPTVTAKIITSSNCVTDVRKKVPHDVSVNYCLACDVKYIFATLDDHQLE